MFFVKGGFKKKLNINMIFFGILVYLMEECMIFNIVRYKVIKK